jgi:hypothetical protein
MLERFTAADFARYRGQRFLIGPPAERRLRRRAHRGIRERGPRAGAKAVLARLPRRPGPPVSQRIYRVEHVELGTIEIFLVPIGPDEVGQRYEAIFT